MNGEEGDIAQEVRKFAQRLAQEVKLPYFSGMRDCRLQRWKI